MTKQTTRPTAETLRAQADILIAEHGKRDAMYDRLDALYDQEQPASEKGVQLVRMPYATNIIDLVADLAAAQKLSIQVSASAETKAAKSDAETFEKWIQAWISHNELVQQCNITRDLAWLGAARGLCVARVLFDGDMVKEAEKGDEGYKVKQLPLLQVRDGRYVYIRWGAFGPQYVVESYLRSAADIRREHPDALTDHEKYPDDSPVKWLEYWDEKYRCYWAGEETIAAGKKGKKLEVVPHGYGCLPYAIGVARSTPRLAPEAKYRPLLAPAETLLHNLDVFYSIEATAGFSAVTNAWVVKSDRIGREGQEQLDTLPGAVNNLAKDEDVVPLQRAPLPGDFPKLGADLERALQMSTFPTAMWGQSEGQMAGYAINMLVQSGRRPLVPIWAAIEAVYEGAARIVFTIAKEKIGPLVGGKVPVYVRSESTKDGLKRGVRSGLELEVAKIPDDFDLTVELSDPMPADEAGNVRMAIETMSKGLLSQETALTKFKVVEDATGEIDRMLVEQIYRELGKKEAEKLAVERGYVPPPQPVEPQPQQPVQPQAMPALPPAMPPPLPPGGAVPPPPGMVPPGVVDPAALQQIAGLPEPMPQLNDMAGMPPMMLPGMV